MNLSTSNFNFKTKTWSLIFITTLLYGLINLIGFSYDKYIGKISENKNQFPNTVDGKYKLARHLYLNQNPDLVFVGNSMTKQHVNSYALYKNGISSFNYAIEGYFIYQYPKMIDNAIKLHPKSIAITLSLDDLYVSFDNFARLYCNDQDLSLYNLFYIFAHLTDKPLSRLHLKSYKPILISYIFQFDYFHKNGYRLRDYIVNTYQSSRYIEIFPSISSDPAQQPILTHNCDFNQNGDRVPFKNCENGDSMLLGQSDTLDKTHYRHINALDNNKLDMDLINILNAFTDKIEAAGIQPIIVFTPSYEQVNYDYDFVQKLVRAPIIDLSKLNVPYEYWYNTHHMNLEGRNLYSHILAQKLKPFKIASHQKYI